MKHWLRNIVRIFSPLYPLIGDLAYARLYYDFLLWRKSSPPIGGFRGYLKNFSPFILLKYTPLYLIIVLSSCEEATEYEFENNILNSIVVNGQLTNERKAHQVILSQPVSKLNEEPKAVSGVYVGIYDGDTVHELQEDLTIKGLYKTDEKFRAVINRYYTLVIITAEKRYYASTYMLPVTPFNSLRYKFDEEKNMFKIDSVNEVFNKDESAIYEVQIDWTNVPGYETIDISKKQAKLYYYTLSTIDISELFAPKKETVYFPAGTTIIESKYSVTPEHASFIRSMLLETEWRGGLFDVSKGNVESNISDGGFGYFAVSTVIRDTIIVQ